MRLTDKCENWNLRYDHDTDLELTEDQKNCFQGILHTAGDSISAIMGIPNDEEELKSNILKIVASIFLDVRGRIQLAIEYAIMNQALLSPLQQGFTDQDLFGENLTESLKGSLKNESEIQIADEYLSPEENDSDEEGEADGTH